MILGGISIILLLGICNFLLLLFQLCSGLRLIKTSIGTHKKAGIVLFIIASLHGILAIAAL